jgi:hypothetical protein
MLGKLTMGTVFLALVAAFALTLAGAASAQDAPGHCPSISKAQMKQILAPYLRDLSKRRMRAA